MALLFVAVAVGPVPVLHAATPGPSCALKKAKDGDCCSHDREAGARPCCRLEPRAPLPNAVLTASAAPVILLAGPLLETSGVTGRGSVVPLSTVAPRARASPLFLLFASLLI